MVVKFNVGIVAYEKNNRWKRIRQRDVAEMHLLERMCIVMLKNHDGNHFSTYEEYKTGDSKS